MGGVDLAAQAQRMLAAKAKVAVKEGVAVLREKDVMTVKLIAVPAGATVINMEKMGSLSGVLDKFLSRSDYLVLFQENGADAAVFVELKKTLREGAKGFEQLRMSLPYLQYLKSLCNIVFEHVGQPSHHISVHYVLVGKQVTPRLAKLPVSDPQRLPDENHRGIVVRRIVGERVRFDRLAGAAS